MNVTQVSIIVLIGVVVVAGIAGSAFSKDTAQRLR
jgi:hypothetical protein